jgi:hypothetical protein
MSFTALRTVLPPTCVEHSVRAHMTSSAHVNLIVARASQLQLYRLLHPHTTTDDTTTSTKASLVLVHERTLFGRIDSLVAFRPPGWPRDLLAVLVSDAKLSILQFDITRHDFVVVSLHYFESSDIHEDDRLSVRPGAFRVDPTSRCGVARVYDRKLIVVPFRGEFAAGDPLGPVDDYRPLPASYALDLDKLSIRHVKDFCFLENYFQPALLLLHDVDLTCPGRAAYRRNSCAVTVLTLDPAQRLAERLWSVDGLPFDTMSVVAAPKAVGGALLLALNTVLYVSEKLRIALPVNTLSVVGPKLSALPMNARPVSPLAVPSVRFVARDTALICTDDGALHALRLIFASGIVKSLAIRRLGRMTPASTITALAPRLVFAGSRLGDSLLLHIREKTREEIVSEAEERKERARREQEEAERAAREAVLEGGDAEADDGGVSDLGALGGEIALIDENDDFADPFALAVQSAMLFVDIVRPEHGRDDDHDDDDDVDDKSAEEQVAKRARTQKEEATEEIADEDNPYAVFETGDSAAATTAAATSATTAAQQHDDDSADDSVNLDDAPVPEFAEPTFVEPPQVDRFDDLHAAPAEEDEAVRPKMPDDALFAPVEDNADELAAVVNAPFGMPLDVPLFRVAVCDTLVGTGPLSGLAVGRTGGIDQREADAAMQAQLASASAAEAAREAANDEEDGNDDVHGVAGPTLSTAMLGEAGVRILPNEPKPGVGLRVVSNGDAMVTSLRAKEHAEHAEAVALKRQHEAQIEELRNEHKQRYQERRARLDAERRDAHGRDRDQVERRYDSDRRAATDRENADLQALRARHAQESAAQQAEHARARAERKDKLEAAEREAKASARNLLLGDEQSSRAELDMVACSGRDRDGALSVLHSSVRPQKLNTLAVPGCRAVWTLHVRAPEGSAPDRHHEHALLILSTAEQTRVLSTGDQLQEVTDQFEVRSDRATLDTFNLFSRAKIAQVHSRGLRLLEGAQVVQDIDLEPDEPAVVASSAADPYVVLLMANGAVQLLTCRADVQMLSVARIFDAPPAAAPRHSPAALTQVTAVALYSRHMSLNEPGPFEPLTPSERAADVADARMSAPDAMALDADAANGANADSKPAEMTAEEEELALYGAVASSSTTTTTTTTTASSTTSVKAEPVAAASTTSASTIEHEFERKPNEATHFLFVTRASGLLEVYAVPSMRLVFATPRFTRGPPLVRHDIRSAAMRAADATTQEPRVNELHVTRLRDRTLQGDDGDVYLFALAESGDLLVYRVFRCVVEARADPTLLPFRLARVEHGFIRRPFSAATATAAASSSLSNGETRVLHIRSMGNVSGIESVVVGGARPVWLMQVRGTLRAHPLFLGHGERGGAAFAAFHHRNCRHGFVYYEPQSEELRLCRLQTDTISYEMQLAIRKVPVNATPHSVVYDRGSGLYVVAVSQTHQVRMIGVSAGAAASAVTARVNAVVEAGERGGDADAMAMAADEYEDMPVDFDEPGGVPLLDTKFELRLLNPSNWETMDRYVLEEAEHVLSMRVCRLKHNESRSLRAYVVVGTGYSRGEDEMSTGRILIFEILMPHMLLRSVSVRPEKAPISAVVDVCGHLLACAGLKVNGFDFADGSTLVPCAFIDLEFFIVSADSIKNYVVLGDAINSVHFFRWRDTREKGRHLIELSRDNNALRVTNTAFVVDEPSLAMAAFDELGHLQMFEYQPHHGQRLVCRAEIGVGTLVPCTVRVRCNRVAAPIALPRQIQDAAAKIERSIADALQRERQCVFFGTRDGSLGVVTPLGESTFRRLRTVLDQLQQSVPWVAGVTPASLRKSKLVKFNEPSTDRLRTLDGDALVHFAELEVSAQRELARRCGTTSKQVMNNLIELVSTIDLL